MLKRAIILLIALLILGLYPAASGAAETNIAFMRDIKSAGLKIISLKYKVDGAKYLFTIECENDAARGYSLFNPPSGDKVKTIVFADGIKPGKSTITIEADKNAVDSLQDNLVMKFWKNDEEGDDFIMFSLKNTVASPIKIEAKKLTSLPSFDPNKGAEWQFDLRNRDLSALDLTGRTSDLLRADFDSLTKWPEKLPDGFSPEKIMQIGKEPGLMVRRLHEKKITGKGISIAIIDQKLDTAHIELEGRLKLYEEIHCLDEQPQMHGSAVSSIALGKTVGVAPDANLYYIAETHGNYAGGTFEIDYSPVAESIARIIEINRTLAANEKIRVISISLGFDPGKKGAKEVMAAIEKAKQEGIFVISSSVEETHGLRFQGLGREPMSDPDSAKSYLPGAWWEKHYYGDPNYLSKPTILVPMDARCTASESSPRNYVFYRNGGWSWSIPYIAGLYALACQAAPETTPETFWAAALKTGEKTTITRDGRNYDLGMIVNSEKLIEELKIKK